LADLADLRNANLFLADLTIAKLCNTTMPDGHAEYSGCSPLE
jgi:hypothetical protein